MRVNCNSSTKEINPVFRNKQKDTTCEPALWNQHLKYQLNLLTTSSFWTNESDPCWLSWWLILREKAGVFFRFVICVFPLHHSNMFVPCVQHVVAVLFILYFTTPSILHTIIWKNFFIGEKIKNIRSKSYSSFFKLGFLSLDLVRDRQSCHNCMIWCSKVSFCCTMCTQDCSQWTSLKHIGR